MTICCDELKHICQECIEPLKQEELSCHSCKKPLQPFPDKELESLLDNLLVYCPQQNAGCTWEGRLRDLTRHQSHCVFPRTLCPHCGCMLCDAESKSHQQSCPFRILRCPFCKTHRDTAANLSSKHYSTCPQIPVPCPRGCGAKPFRKNLARHVKKRCHMATTRKKSVGKAASSAASRIPVLVSPTRYTKSVQEPGTTASNCCEVLPSSAFTLRQHITDKDCATSESDVHCASNSFLVVRSSAKSNSTGGSSGGNCPSFSIPESTDIPVAREHSDSVASKENAIKYLCVTNLAPGTSLFMLRFMFSRYGAVKHVQLNKGLELAVVAYRSEHSAKIALKQSRERGIVLLNHRLLLDPIY